MKFPLFMMATEAYHKMGDISSAKYDICSIYKEVSDEIHGECFVGNWVYGFGLIDVKFPKSTTRPLTDEEFHRYGFDNKDKDKDKYRIQNTMESMNIPIDAKKHPIMRCYSFVPDLYINEKQMGIQSCHAMAEVALGVSRGKYSTKQMQAFQQWADIDKTMVMLQGKNHGTLSWLLKEFENAQKIVKEMIVQPFFEDEQSMNKMLTCVMVIAPDYIWDKTIEPPIGCETICEQIRTRYLV